ncbi:MAG: aminotransferase class I/II-fold pyridoxal phosphate-dependent enzyme [Streptosporangiales bacterium]|nr:aminotransferase class I/II-fold pyridoxal phosphate-dependent enzyme [Streptosporangiales bacterium]
MSEDSSVAGLASDLRGRVGALRPGDRLPSSRELMRRHRVSPVTVSRALGLLAAEGLIVTRPGAGTYVADPPRGVAGAADLSWQTVALGERTIQADGVLRLLALPAPGVIPLAGGYLHQDLQPSRALGTAMARASRRPDAWERVPVAGLPELRSWFARAVGGAATVDDVLIAGGGQAALSVAFRALAPPGAPVLVESPTYPGAMEIARAAGLRPVPVPMDDDGVLPELLAEAFAATGARVFHCQPLHANPTGAVLAPDRHEQVLAVARAAGAFVVEDDYARYLSIEAPPPPLARYDAHGTVVHLASLTKATAPSMRIAALVARGPVAERLRTAHAVDTFFVPRPLQEAALELVSAPAWTRHLKSVAAHLRSRRNLLAAEVTARLPGARLRPPAGGLHLWVRLPGWADDAALADEALRAGVVVTPGRLFYAAEPPGAYVRLAYGAAAETDLAEGVRRLATVWPTPTT